MKKFKDCRWGHSAITLVENDLNYTEALGELRSIDGVVNMVDYSCSPFLLFSVRKWNTIVVSSWGQ